MMKLFNRISVRLIPLAIMAAALCFPVGGTLREITLSAPVNTPEMPQTLPFSGKPATPPEKNSPEIQGIIPGSYTALSVSRRNHNPLPQRLFRDGNADITDHQSALTAQFCHAEKQKFSSAFVFRNFLRRCLPVRASPHLV